ncbi:hypothetical protein CFC21_028730, partial [Triticum aestivum]
GGLPRQAAHPRRRRRLPAAARAGHAAAGLLHGARHAGLQEALDVLPLLPLLHAQPQPGAPPLLLLLRGLPAGLLQVPRPGGRQVPGARHPGQAPPAPALPAALARQAHPPGARAAARPAAPGDPRGGRRRRRREGPRQGLRLQQGLRRQVRPRGRGRAGPLRIHLRRQDQEGGAQGGRRRRQGHSQGQDDNIHCYRGCPEGGENFEGFSRAQELGQFYDAYEDNENVYIVMELCEGGELLDRILSRGGKYSEDDAKSVLVQILNVVAFCHIQGVVHRDLKPENFLFTSKDENSQLKTIDFGLSDFVKPDERLNDIVGSAYYVAPEVLHRCYSTEADVWSIGVIAYILLCGSRPFWARTESGIFRSVLKADPSYNEAPWPSLTPEAMDFVKRLLCKDPRRRMTAAQALGHPWIRNYNDIKMPLDVLIFRLIKAYIRSSSLRKAALKALSKTLTVDELFYLKGQFSLLEPDRNGCITLDNIRMALTREATDAMKETRVQEILVSLSALQYRRMDFHEFCAAAVSVHQLEALDRWEQHARSAYEIFEKDGNRAIVIDELASELGLSPSVPLHVVLQDWIRHTDGKLSFLGFVKLLHGMSSRSLSKMR